MISSAGPRRRCHALVTGGGTSGHVLPAIAIMDRLAAAGHHRETLHYAGTRLGNEPRLLPPTGYVATFFDVVGLQRALSLRNVEFVPKLVRATWLAVRLLRRLRPAVVVNVGGYASMPCTIAALLCRVPVVVVSYDRRPGLASRLSARWAATVAAAFEDSPLPRARTTGAPIRAEIIAIDRAADRAGARARLGVPDDRFMIAVFGGSLGAKVINEAVEGLVERWGDRGDLYVHHVVGERWLGEVSPSPPALQGQAGIMYHVIGYDDRISELYAASDLMITRAGASTIAELAATGTPAIVVPWPDAAENHQLDNARTLSDLGAAVLVEQAALTVDRLCSEVDDLVAHPERRATISRAARAAGERHRGDSLIDLIDEVAAR